MPCHPPAALCHRRHCAAALTIAVSLALFVARPALATVEFSYIFVLPSSTSLALQWGTASEVDVAGFDVLLKPATAPDSAYEPAGFVPAVGGPDADADYWFPITTLESGVAYCIRLAERTTNASPGEVIDRCGYGIGITPTPIVVWPTVLPLTPASGTPVGYPGPPAEQPTPTPTPNTRPVPVPEPLTLLLFGAGLAGIGVAVRRRGRR